MTDHHMHTKEFFIAAAVGSLLGGAAALLVAPKSGKKLRENICCTCSDLSDSVHDAASDLIEKGRSFTNRSTRKTYGLTDRAKSFVGNLRNGARNLVSEEEEAEELYHHRELLIGGLAGGIFGAIAGLLIAPKSGDELRQDLSDKYEEVANDFVDTAAKKGKTFVKKGNAWINLAKEVIEGLTDEAEEVAEDYTEKAKKFAHSSHLDEIAEWASLGMRVWQRLKDRH